MPRLRVTKNSMPRSDSLEKMTGATSVIPGSVSASSMSEVMSASSCSRTTPAGTCDLRARKRPLEVRQGLLVERVVLTEDDHVLHALLGIG